MNKPLNIKLFLTSCFLFILSLGFSQSVELYGGANNNTFYNCSYDDGGWQEYSSDSKWGYIFGVAYENLELKPLNIRLTLGFENYNGHITVVTTKCKLSILFDQTLYFQTHLINVLVKMCIIH